MKLISLLIMTTLAYASQKHVETTLGEFRTCVEKLNRETNFLENNFLNHFIKYDEKLSNQLAAKTPLNTVLEDTKRERAFLLADNHDLFLYGNGIMTCKDLSEEISERLKIYKALGVISFGLILTCLVFWLFRSFRVFKLKWVAIYACLVSLPIYADQLNIYAYEGINGKDGLGEILKQEFKKATHHELKLITFGSAGEALNQIIIEGKNTKADVLLGIDSSFSSRAVDSGLFSPIPSGHFSRLPSNITLDDEKFFLPFDYGYLAFLYNQQKVNPTSFFKDKVTLSQFMQAKGLKKTVVMADPRTSSIGFSFLRWTVEAVKEKSQLKELWTSFFSNVLSFPPNWSGAYGMFVRGEADWALSYSTSRAYHLEKEKKSQYQVLVFDDGHALQVEGVGLVKSSTKKALAGDFFKVLLSRPVQSRIPTTQWMYPISNEVTLPKSFADLPTPKTRLFSVKLHESERKQLIKDWTSWGASVP